MPVKILMGDGSQSAESALPENVITGEESETTIFSFSLLGKDSPRPQLFCCIDAVYVTVTLRSASLIRSLACICHLLPQGLDLGVPFRQLHRGNGPLHPLFVGVEL